MASSIAGVGSKGSSRLTSRRKINSRSSSDSFGNSAIISCTLIFEEYFPRLICKGQSPRQPLKALSVWVSFCCWWRWRGRMVLPRGRMDFRGCHCAPVSSPFFERPIPAKINQGSNNNYFEQQSHRKGEIRKRLRAKAIFNFFVES